MVWAMNGWIIGKHSEPYFHISPLVYMVSACSCMTSTLWKYYLKCSRKRKLSSGVIATTSNQLFSELLVLPIVVLTHIPPSWQCGTTWLHVPSDWQVMDRAPTTCHPASQLNETVVPMAELTLTSAPCRWGSDNEIGGQDSEEAIKYTMMEACLSGLLSFLSYLVCGGRERKSFMSLSPLLQSCFA